MGLDMYLSKRTYVKRWDHQSEAVTHSVTVTKGGKPHPEFKPERVSHVIEEVAYWRKANAIHKWFVDHVQSGNDDCREYYVDQDQLRELVDLCKQVIRSVECVTGDVADGATYHPDGRVEQHTHPGPVVAQGGLAAKLMPTQGGFFFGGTDYDEHYLQDLTETVEMLEPLLDEETGEFYYRSSW